MGPNTYFLSGACSTEKKQNSIFHKGASGATEDITVNLHYFFSPGDNRKSQDSVEIYRREQTIVGGDNTYPLFGQTGIQNGNA